MLPRLSHVYRLATDPKVQLVKRPGRPKEDAVLSLRLAASDSRWNDHLHQWEDVGRLFIDAEMWGDDVHNIAAHLTKGNEVYVSGALVLDEWKNRNGETRSRVKVRARYIKPVVRVEKPDRPASARDDDEPPF